MFMTVAWCWLMVEWGYFMGRSGDVDKMKYDIKLLQAHFASSTPLKRMKVGIWTGSDGYGMTMYDSKPFKTLVLPMFYHPFAQKWLKNSLDVHPPHMSNSVFFFVFFQVSIHIFQPSHLAATLAKSLFVTWHTGRGRRRLCPSCAFGQVLEQVEQLATSWSGGV